MRKGSDPKRARRARMGLRLDAPPAQVHRDRRRALEAEVARAEMEQVPHSASARRVIADRLLLELTPAEAVLVHALGQALSAGARTAIMNALLVAANELATCEQIAPGTRNTLTAAAAAYRQELASSGRRV